MEGKACWSVDACEATRNVDCLLERYRRERAAALLLLLESPEKLEALPSDPSCRWQMGAGEPGPYCCTECSNLRRLGDRRYPLTEILIECGREVGSRLQIEAEEAVSSLQLSPPFLFCDPFSADVLLAWLFEFAARAKGLPHYHRLHTAFLCGERGHKLWDAPTLGDIFDLAERNNLEEDAPAVLSQLAAALRVARSLGCGLGPRTRLFFDDRPCGDVDFTLVLRPSGSARVFGLSLLSPSPVSRALSSSPALLSLPSPPPTFHLTGENCTLLQSGRGCGLPLPETDFYFLLVSLVACPAFLEAVSSLEIWSAIWKGREKEVEERLSAGLPPEETLRGLPLRRDVLDLLP